MDQPQDTAHAPAPIAQLEAQLAGQRRRQRWLEIQRGRIDRTDALAPIQAELERATAEITRLEAELRRLRPVPAAADSPYPGLRTFQEADMARFFGRDAMIADLAERAGNSALLALLDASGSGASSTMRAGLLPMLRAGAADGSERWLYAPPLTPGAQPLASLAAALTSMPGGAALGSAPELQKQLATHADALLAAADVLRRHADAPRLVLLIDQAEELWTLAPDDDDQQRAFAAQQQRPFIQQLLRAIGAPGQPVLLLLCLRTDFLNRAAEQPALAQAIQAHAAFMRPLDADELRTAIERPARAAGGSFEAGLVDALVEQTQQSPGALPLLASALRELWAARGADGRMTHAALQALGGVAGALARRADSILAEQYTAEQRAQLQTMLPRLVQPGAGVADARRPVQLGELASAQRSPKDVRALLAPLADAQLLMLGDAGAGAQATAELAHEALIWAWPTLRLWVDAARADRQLLSQLGAAAQAQDRQEHNQPKLPPHQPAPAATSRARATQQRAPLRLRWLAGILAVALIGALGAGFLVRSASSPASNQHDAEQTVESQSQRQLRVTQSQALAYAAESVRSTQPETALLLANEANRRDDNQVTQQALRDALDAAPWQPLMLQGHTGSVRSVAFSPDGQHILTASVDKTARLWDLQGHEIAILKKHTRPVVSVVFSTDGQRILTASADKTARLWDLQGHEIAILQGHTEPVTSAVFSPDGQRILTASADKTARLWDIAGQPLAILQGHTGSVTSAVFSSDGHHILTTAENDGARLWDRQGNKLINIPDHIEWGTQAVFSSDGQHILTASNDEKVRQWDLQGNEIIVIQGHTGSITSVMSSPDEKQHILTTSEDRSARLWDNQGHAITHFQIKDGPFQSAVFSPDGQRILTTSVDNTARLWDLQGHEIAVLQGHTNHIWSAVFSSDGRRILTSSEDGTVRLWNLKDQPFATAQGFPYDIRHAVFSPDGKRVLTILNQTGQLWDAQGQPLATLQGHTDNITSIVFSPNGQYILTASSDNTARLWDITGRPLATLQGHSRTVRRAVFSPDGHYILTASSDNTARLWDITGRPLTTLRGHTNTVTSAIFSPDQRYILTTSYDSTARLWDLQGHILVTFKGHTAEIWRAIFSPDGQHILTASADHTARLWNLQGYETAIFGYIYDDVNSAVFSSDGQRILTTSGSTPPRLWNLRGQEITTLQSNTDYVRDAVFSPDGQRILTSSMNGTVRLWDGQGHYLAILQHNTSGTWSTVFSLDSRHILIDTADGVVRQYLTYSEDLRAIAACHVGRGLTEEEIQQFQVPTPLLFDFSARQCPPPIDK